MARVNITVPDDVVIAARSVGLNLSAVATAALRQELDKRAKVLALDAQLAELERELGPIPARDVEEARRWADEVVGPPGRPRRRAV